MPLKLQTILFNRFNWLYLLLFYPIFDFLLRKLPVSFIASVWDDGLLIITGIVALWRMLETNRKLPSMKHALLAFFMLGVGLIFMDMKHFQIDLEGFRADFQYMIGLFVGFTFLNERTEAKRIIKILVYIAVIIGLYGLAQVAMHVPTPAGWTDASETIRTRAFSIVQSPNILGSYMALMSPIALGIALAEKGKKRLFWIGLSLVLMAALMFTYSRGAWFAFAASIGIISMLLDKRLFIALIVAVVLTGVFVPSITHRVTNLFTDQYIEKSTQDGRIGRWLGSYDVMRDNPFYGKGLGHYGGAVGQRSFGTIYVDSYYFKTLAETGLVGISLFFWLLGAVVKNVYRIWRSQKDRKTFYFYGGMVAGIIAVVLHNAVENIFEMPFMNTYFWLIAGIMLSYPYLKPAGGEEQHEK
jgi:putative inorganic carbon (hco3(-)) transporter